MEVEWPCSSVPMRLMWSFPWKYALAQKAHFELFVRRLVRRWHHIFLGPWTKGQTTLWRPTFPHLTKTFGAKFKAGGRPNRLAASSPPRRRRQASPRQRERLGIVTKRAFCGKIPIHNYQTTTWLLRNSCTPWRRGSPMTLASLALTVIRSATTSKRATARNFPPKKPPPRSNVNGSFHITRSSIQTSRERFEEC